MEKMSLKLENISKSYPDRLILDRFSLEFKPGSITCLFGPSGCGKTTLLKLMSGLSTVDSGSVSGFAEEKISFIFQETRILPWKTVLENVMFPLVDKFSRKQATDIARKFIRLVGLEKEEEFFPYQLSGGMKQRVSIARAFAFPGTLVLMDEAFQNLDIKLKNSILDAFLNIWKEDGRTVIFVTHDIEEAIKLGQQIIFLNNSPLQIIRLVNTDESSAGEIKSAVGEIYQQ
jgi:NitT/TauT family transport system ATP-binding protein